MTTKRFEEAQLRLNLAAKDYGMVSAGRRVSHTQIDALVAALLRAAQEYYKALREADATTEPPNRVIVASGVAVPANILIDEDPFLP